MINVWLLWFVCTVLLSTLVLNFHVPQDTSQVSVSFILFCSTPTRAATPYCFTNNFGEWHVPHLSELPSPTVSPITLGGGKQSLWNIKHFTLRASHTFLSIDDLEMWTVATWWFRIATLLWSGPSDLMEWAPCIWNISFDVCSVQSAVLQKYWC